MFIVFDGIDGSGKSTHLKLVSKWLKNEKIPFLKIREPGGCKNAEKIRKLFVKMQMDPLSQLLLVSAGRHENMLLLKENSDKLIICDRFIDSTYAYQGVFLDKKIIDQVVDLSVDIYPDFVFMFLNRYIEKHINHFDEFAQEKYENIINIFKSRIKDNYMIVPDEDIMIQHEIIKNKILELLKI